MNSLTLSELIPGSFVKNQGHLDWGIGQVQSSINNFVTVNFENVGKKVIDIRNINLQIIRL